MRDDEETPMTRRRRSRRGRDRAGRRGPAALARGGRGGRGRRRPVDRQAGRGDRHRPGRDRRHRRRPLLARQSRPGRRRQRRSSPPRRATTRSGPTIRGGMNVSGEGDTAVAASEGAAAAAAISTSTRVAEAPVAPGQRRRRRARAAARAPAAAPGAGRRSRAPRSGAAPSGPTIQLGAFSSPAGGEQCLARAGRPLPLSRPARPPVVAGPGRRPHPLPPARQRPRRAATSAAACRAAGEACSAIGRTHSPPRAGGDAMARCFPRSSACPASPSPTTSAPSVREAEPAGFILFGAQRRGPGAAPRADRLACATLSGRADLPILIDQEGGRVARLRPPRMARIPGAVALRRALREGADQRDRGGAGQRAGDRGDARRGRDQRRLPAAARRARRRARTT